MGRTSITFSILAFLSMVVFSTTSLKLIFPKSIRLQSNSNLYRSDNSHLYSVDESSIQTVEVVNTVEDNDLDVGDLENMKFVRIKKSSPADKFRLEGSIKSKELNSYLDEYKAEMKARKVVFPGFRSGKLPPYVMGDVRKYIISYGLESNLGQLCNMNGLIICKENGDDVTFGDDAFYAEIFMEDFRGYDFAKQRDAWREGTDFNFAVEFFAKVDAEENEEKTINKSDAIEVAAETE